MFNLCPPALIYVVFSITQIIIDLFKGLYNTAFFKVIVMGMVTLLLNALCQGGLGIISWIIVFIPFILMTVIVTMLLYIFGLDAASGTINYKCQDQGTSNNVKNVTIVPAPSTSSTPDYLSNKKIIIVDTNPNTTSTITQQQQQQPVQSVQSNAFAPNYSSSPEYQS